MKTLLRIALSFSVSYCFVISLRAQDFPVDHNTGRLLINIPLASVSDRTLSHTIGLAYDASGVKVDGSSGWVGTNWTLLGGGEVRRVMRGIPDDYYSGADVRSGWLYNSNASTIGSYTVPVDGSALNCDTETLHYTFLNGLLNKDTEPDLFYFSGGGISGSFVFDNTGSISSIKLIPYQDVQVIPFRSSPAAPISKFTIITDQGVKYVFGGSTDFTESGFSKAELDYGASDPYYFRTNYHRNKSGYPATLYSVWKLASIESPVKEKITFQYDRNTINSGSTIKYALTAATDSNLPEEIVSYREFQIIDRLVLRAVTSPHQNILINTTGTGEDLRLNSIVVNEITPTTSEFVKQIDFTYSGSLRVYLKKIQVADACNVYQPYVFEYDPTAVPLSGSVNQDIWGYALTTNVTSHKYPKLYVYQGSSGIHRISLFPISGQTATATIPGSNRIPANATPVGGTLIGIQYPSGFAAKFTYEPHEFFNPITNSVSKGGGLRIKTINVSDGIAVQNNIIRNFEYKKPDNSTSGKLITLPTFWQLSASHKAANGTITDYAGMSALSDAEKWAKLIVRTDRNMSQDAESLPNVLYEYVTESIGTSQGKTLYQFDIPNSYGAAATSDWNPTFVHIARKKNITCANVALNLPGFYQHPFMSQTPYAFARGLLYKKSIYAQSDLVNPETETIYEYQDKTIAGATVSGIQFEYIPLNATTYYFMYGKYAAFANKEKVLTRITTKTKSKNAVAYLQNIVDYTYEGSHLAPTYITTTNSDLTLSAKRFKYVKDFGAPQASNATTPLQVRMIDSLYAAGQTGVLIEQTASLKPSGGLETTYGGSLVYFNDFKWAPSQKAIIRPQETYDLRTNGITGFAMSSYSGSGTTRTFTRNAAYKLNGKYEYHSFGDLLWTENEQRQLQSFHPDSLTGVATATLVNVLPQEVIYSNFDQDTPFDFTLSAAFTALEKSAIGRSSETGLAGWKSGAATRILTKTLVRKPGARYKFSAWYKAPIVTGVHSFNVVIKSTVGVQLLTSPVSFAITNTTDWVYAETVVDLPGVLSNTNPTVVVELSYSGDVVHKFGGILDDVTFAPEGAEFVRSAYHTAFGPTSVTSPEGRITEREYFPNGKLRYIRDHEGNIVQRSVVESYIPAGQPDVPINIVTAPVLYDNEVTNLIATTSCLDFTTLQWKVTPAANPSGGTYTNGSDVQPYTFTTYGDFIISLKITHSSFGTYEVSKTVTVEPLPLAVTICVQQGALNVDLCQTTAQQTESCSGQTGSVNAYSTTFSASVTGCPTGTYSYAWQTRPMGDPYATWSQIGTGTTQVVTNTSSYDIRCEVTSTCLKSGMSSTKSVYVFSSDSSCGLGN